MAPFNKFGKNTGKHTAKNTNQSKKQTPGFKKVKRKWVPDDKIFHGSVQEGQGFAFKRKQKAQHAYNKLLRKERRVNPVKTAFEHEYPEHLKHLYQAEADRLRKEDQLKQRRRRKAPPAEDATVEDTHTSHTAPQSFSSPDLPLPQPEVAESSSPSKKKMRKTSYQKTREEYERNKEKRAEKKEEALRNKQQREEALKVYKQKKMQTYQVLCKKTRKGQPNLNLQMEYLLQKIHNKSQTQTK